MYFKLENLQHTNSFKARGACNKVFEIVQSLKQRNPDIDMSSIEFVCASGGNHGLGMVYAARMLGCRAHVFVFETVSDQKKQAIQKLGGELHVFGKVWDETNQEAMRYVAEEPETRHLIHPFDDETVILGQGTIALEVIEQFNKLNENLVDASLDAVVVSVGGGGLSSGVSSILKELSPKTRVYIVEATGAPTMHMSLKHNELITLESVSTICEGLATKKVSQRTLDYVRDNTEHSFLVSDRESMNSLREILQHDKQLTEPSTSCSVAALPQVFEYHQQKFGEPIKNIAVILCGGNFGLDKLNLLSE